MITATPPPTTVRNPSPKAMATITDTISFTTILLPIHKLTIHLHGSLVRQPGLPGKGRQFLCGIAGQVRLPYTASGSIGVRRNEAGRELEPAARGIAAERWVESMTNSAAVTNGGKQDSPLHALRSMAVVLGPALVAGAAVVLGGVASVTMLFRTRGKRKGPIGLFAALVTLTAAVYEFGVRPWTLSWGATPGESSQALPGDELIPRPSWQATRAISIRAAPEDVWRWLVQIGQGRGGFYTYDWLENLAELDIHSTDRIQPELQQLRVGDSVRLAPGQDTFRVAVLEAQRALVLVVNAVPVFTWAFVLQPGGSGTRVIARSRIGGRWGRLMAAAYALAVEPQHFIMERGMLLGIKARAERAA